MIEDSEHRAAENECKILRQQGRPCSLDSSGNASQDFILFDVEISAENPKMNYSSSSSEYFVINRDMPSTNPRNTGASSVYNPWAAFVVNLLASICGKIPPCHL